MLALPYNWPLRGFELRISWTWVSSSNHWPIVKYLWGSYVICLYWVRPYRYRTYIKIHWNTKRLIFKRSRVWIPAPDTGWTFSNEFVVKFVLFVWKAIRGWQFKNSLRFFLLAGPSQDSLSYLKSRVLSPPLFFKNKWSHLKG